MKLYGIPNCDTVKKARVFLDTHGMSYVFHDYKKQAPDAVVLERAIERFGWEKVVNRAGMTWRKFTDEQKAAVTDEASALKLMLANASVIKRPILDTGDELLLGFKEAEYQQRLLADAG